MTTKKNDEKETGRGFTWANILRNMKAEVQMNSTMAKVVGIPPLQLLACRLNRHLVRAPFDSKRSAGSSVRLTWASCDWNDQFWSGQSMWN